VEVEVRVSEVPEELLPGEHPVAYACRLSADKCAAVAGEARAGGDQRPVLAADTIVVLDGEVLEKPAHREEARAMIQALAGRGHEVVTAYCLDSPNDKITQAITTRVIFRHLSGQEIEAYLDGEEWRDKAGAYGIQGMAAHMALEVHGSYTNVVGLPLAQVMMALKELRR